MAKPLIRKLSLLPTDWHPLYRFFFAYYQRNNSRKDTYTAKESSSRLEVSRKVAITLPLVA